MNSERSSFYQVLTSTLQPNTTYTFTADVGRPSDLNFGGGSIELGYGSAFGTNRLTATTRFAPHARCRQLGPVAEDVCDRDNGRAGPIPASRVCRRYRPDNDRQLPARCGDERGFRTAQPVTIIFPVTLQSGQYIEMNSMSDAKLYDGNGFPISSVTPTGVCPLAAGVNTVTFNSTPTSGNNARANVTIASYDVQSATVESVVVNDGNVQRSKVNSVTVTFSEIMTIDPGAFEVRKTGTGGGLVSVAAAFAIQNGKTVATLTFSGGLTEYGSLKDGEYQLTVRADKVRDSVTQTALDGDGQRAARWRLLFWQLPGRRLLPKVWRQRWRPRRRHRGLCTIQAIVSQTAAIQMVLGLRWGWRCGYRGPCTIQVALLDLESGSFSTLFWEDFAMKQQAAVWCAMCVIVSLGWSGAARPRTRSRSTRRTIWSLGWHGERQSSLKKPSVREPRYWTRTGRHVRCGGQAQLAQSGRPVLPIRRRSWRRRTLRPIVDSTTRLA